MHTAIFTCDVRVMSVALLFIGVSETWTYFQRLRRGVPRSRLSKGRHGEQRGQDAPAGPC